MMNECRFNVLNITFSHQILEHITNTWVRKVPNMCKLLFKLFWRNCVHLTRVVRYSSHDDVIKWKHFPRYRPFVRGIHRSPVNSPHKGQWRGALMFSLICVWINGWVNDGEAGDLRRYCAHYDVIVMLCMVSGIDWSRVRHERIPWTNAQLLLIARQG